MDLDVDQVLTDILLRPLSAMVEHIPFLYRIAARITRQYPEGILNFNLVAIAKELMIAMSMFELSQYYDFRNTQWRCLFKINGSSSKIASQNWSLRVACSFAAACSSAAADMLMLRVDDVKDDDEQTKNDLRFLTQDFKRISIEFQCVSEMIFGDRPSNPDVVHEHILHSNSSWRISFPPNHQNHGLVFNGALPLDILVNVISAVSHLKIALVAMQDLLQTSQDIVNVDLITDLVAELIPVHSFLEYHFPTQIEPAIHAYNSWDRFKLLECAMCDALDVVTMAAVAIQSLKVQNMTSGQVEEDKMRPLSYAASKLFTAAYLFGAIHNNFMRIFSQERQNS